MATWNVDEPNINLRVSDMPMFYRAAYGPSFALNISWEFRIWSRSFGFGSFGFGWSFGFGEFRIWKFRIWSQI